MTLRLSNPHYSLLVHQLYMGMETKETGDATKSITQVPLHFSLSVVHLLAIVTEKTVRV